VTARLLGPIAAVALAIAAVALAVTACSGAAVSSSAAPSGAAASSQGAPSAAAPSASAPSAAASAAAVDLTIYGASSLKAALAKAKTAYEAANPGTTLTISTDSSTALETKIEQGAPADVFLSADTKNPQKLAGKGLAAGAITRFAGNLLTIVVPTANPAGIQAPADLAKAGVKVIAAGDAVPIAKYASQLVANLAKLPGYPADFAAAYAANVASKEDNVAAVVAKVELGEGDAGIVYVTDARSSGKVTTIPIPDGANVPATYAGVVVKASSNLHAATAFMTWLAGPEGEAILASFGFLPPA
jgi:molybdate transport system substrate-binding protein